MKDTELHRRLPTPFATVAIGLAVAFGGGTAMAQDEDVNAVWTSESGEPWTSESGECWRNPEEPGQPMEACGDAMPMTEMEPDAAPAEPTTRTEITVQELNLDALTLFGFGEATLTQDGMDLIDDALDEERGDWNLTEVEIRGYTDRIGSEEFNQQLSEQRAQAVAEYVRGHTEMGGVDLTMRGFGESDPMVECENTGSRDALIECLAPNRRVEMDLNLERTVRRQVTE